MTATVARLVRIFSRNPFVLSLMSPTSVKRATVRGYDGTLSRRVPCPGRSYRRTFYAHRPTSPFPGHIQHTRPNRVRRLAGEVRSAPGDGILQARPQGHT